MSAAAIDAEYFDTAVLEKVESQRVPGELTPVYNPSPARSTDGRLDDIKLETGSATSSSNTAEARQPIIHRPTGLKVIIPLNLSDIFSSGLY